MSCPSIAHPPSITCINNNKHTQTHVGDEVEAGKELLLGVQVLVEGALTQFEAGPEAAEELQAALDGAGLELFVCVCGFVDRVRRGRSMRMRVGSFRTEPMRHSHADVQTEMGTGTHDRGLGGGGVLHELLELGVDALKPLWCVCM